MSPVAYGRYLAPTRHNEAGRRSAVRRSSITPRLRIIEDRRLLNRKNLTINSINNHQGGRAMARL